MSKNKIENGFLIRGNSTFKPLPDDLFDPPNKEYEKIIIEQISEELRKEIDKLINQNKDK